MAWSNGEQLDGYDDEKELNAYISRNLLSYLGEFEVMVYQVSVKREKASRSGAVAERLRRDIECEPNEILEASKADHRTMFKRIHDRIHSGQLNVNRCPKCNRVLRTPKSQQCFWCGHDWHHTV
jgi:rubrerythrin